MIKIELHNEFSSNLKDKWISVEKNFLKNPFNSFYWVNHWYNTVGVKSFKLKPQIILIFKNKNLSYILPLCIINRNGINVLEWIGDIHSDYSNPLIISNFINNHKIFSNVWYKILSKLEKFDLINLKRQKFKIDNNLENPFVKYLINNVHDISYQLNIDNPWEVFSKEKRKKKILMDSNRQRRRIEKYGVINFIIPDQSITKNKIISKMIEFKRYRYNLMKVKDLLSSKHNRDFYFGLDNALKGGILKLHVSALLIDDEIVATHLGTILNNKFYYLMPSNNFTRWQRYSVGRLLLEELLKKSFNDKFEVFDFSIGDEPYKKNWCNQKTELHQHIRSLNTKGFIYKLYLMSKTKFIKSNFWKKIKFLRK